MSLVSLQLDMPLLVDIYGKRAFLWIEMEEDKMEE